MYCSWQHRYSPNSTLVKPWFMHMKTDLVSSLMSMLGVRRKGIPKGVSLEIR